MRIRLPEPVRSIWTSLVGSPKAESTVDGAVSQLKMASADPPQIPRARRPKRSRGAASVSGTSRKGEDPRELRFELLHDGQIEELPDPEYLIDEILPETSFTVLYGPPGSYKTFLVLDWAFSIATGQPWAGREVSEGPVVFVSAEGQAGLKLRVRAWKSRFGFEEGERAGAGVHFVTVPVRLLQEKDVEGLIEVIEAKLPESPSLIVFDTLARCTAGGDENSAKDMGRAVAAADELRDATDAAVLFIHHTGREDQTHPRGSTALEGAADMIASLKSPRRLSAILSCKKQKDGEEFEGIELELVEAAESLAVEVLGVAEEAVSLNDSDRQALQVLEAEFDDEGARYNEWEEVAALAHGTFDRARQRLVTMELVEHEGERYRVTPKGRFALTPTPTGVPPKSHGTDAD